MGIGGGGIMEYFLTLTRFFRGEMARSGAWRAGGNDGRNDLRSDDRGLGSINRVA